jgi:hypothetical protein
MRAAIGVRVHSGWAALVAVAGPAGSPEVIERRRLELVEGSLPKQPYHAAEAMLGKVGLGAAEDLITRAAARAGRMARDGMAAAVADLAGRGYAAAGCGILIASGRVLPGVAGILASHALIHSAEGELYREAVAAGARESRLAVVRIRERDVRTRGEAALGIPAERLAVTLVGMGKALGAPWTEDQKLAALAAWLVLAGP